MDLLLPKGTRLLHIGPHKTGTTSLQGAFHKNRDRLAEHGVHYAGKGRQPRAAAAAVTLERVLDGFSASSAADWPALVKEVASSDADRVVISSETFANAAPEVAATVIEAFGPQTHVVITLRPLVKLLPSQWQQFVQAGSTIAYADWLETIFDDDDTSRRSRRFWRRHRHDALAARWADAAGTDNVTVVVLDESDRRMNFAVFERLVGLPQGFLVTDEMSNRSLSLPEVELMREVNRQYKEMGWPPDLYARVFRYGVDDYLKMRPLPTDEPRVETPAWAVERANAVATEMIESLGCSGVRIVGDLAHLRSDQDAPEAISELKETTPEIAARAVIGVLGQRESWTDPTSGSAVSSAALLRTVAARAKSRATQRFRR